MARLRSELVPLAIPVALCLVAWAVIIARPATMARHVPSPRPEVTLERHPRRPPTPAPAAPSATPEPPAHTDAATAPEAAETHASATTAARGEEVTGEVFFEGLGISGTSYWEEDWRAENYRWERWYFYARREWAEWRRARREAFARRVRTTLQPGDASALGDEDPGSPICAVFASACRAGARRVVLSTSPSTAPAAPATLRRDGHVWRLSNNLVEASIDPTALCAIALSRRDEGALPALTVATPEEVPCTVTETMPPDTTVDRGGVAVAITWSGSGWSQRAVLSLSDDATSPELAVARSERSGASIATTLTNLTASALTWTINGHDVSVPSAQIAHLGG